MHCCYDYNGFSILMRILLVSPRTPDTFWSFKHAVRFVSRKASMAPLGLLTVAAMLPSDWELKLVDQNVTQLTDKDLNWADYVFLSAMIVHQEAVQEIAARCARMNKTIIAGGPLFTTGYQAFEEIHHFVLGEAEALLHEVVTDLSAGTLKPLYQSTHRPDMMTSPIPRWDLLRFKDYVTMSVQFSRGCPFECEFCDIIVMNGRVPRLKSPSQLIAELDALRKGGWKDNVFIVDDNFIGNKRRTRELLECLIAWREQTRARISFLTEASINLADDPELCALMVRAGFKKVFVGIETPSTEALEECHKVQNRNRDLLTAVQILQHAGLEVMGGFIVGFDSDKQDIFKRQFEFIQKSGVVTAMVGLLTALPQTRLWHRLKGEGRLEAETSGNNTEAELNFKPRLNREFLQAGYRDLMTRLYEPKNYYQRIRTFLKQHQPCGPRARLSRADVLAFFRSFWALGVWHRGRLGYWRLFWNTLVRRPRQFARAMELAIIGYHFRRVAAQTFVTTDARKLRRLKRELHHG
jgi:radical SAM superfamily enzyme YgiQ (UPF0313 family)